MSSDVNIPLRKEFKDYRDERLKESGGPFHAPDRTRARVKEAVEARFALQRLKGAVFRQFRTSKPLRIVGWGGATTAVVVAAALAWNRGGPESDLNGKRAPGGNEKAVAANLASTATAERGDGGTSLGPGEPNASSSPLVGSAEDIGTSEAASDSPLPSPSETFPSLSAVEAPTDSSILLAKLETPSAAERLPAAHTPPAAAAELEASEKSLTSGDSSSKETALLAVNLNVHLSLGLLEPLRVMSIGAGSGAPFTVASSSGRLAGRPGAGSSKVAPVSVPTAEGGVRPARFEQWFVRTAETERHRNLNSPPLPTVLERFCLRDDGRRWSICERDGSAYEVVLTSPFDGTDAVGTASQALESVCENGGFEFKAVGENARSGEWVVFDGRVGCTQCEGETHLAINSPGADSSPAHLADSHELTVDGMVWLGERTRFKVRALPQPSESVLFTAR